jgi:beta-glucosidase
MSILSSFALLSNLLLGVTGSAARFGGAEPGSTWYGWVQRGKIKNGVGSTLAADHSDLWREDALLMRTLGMRTCRIAASWALIEPREGTFDRAAVDRLREEILLLRGLGIIPLLTLHHFSEPAWFAEKGGWENAENARYFLQFAEYLVRQLGHLVSEYVTIHEPNVYALRGYLTGDWPPEKRHGSPAAALRVLSVLAGTHIRCYRLIHDLRRQLGFTDTKVGFSLLMHAARPKRRLPHVPAGTAHLETELFENRPLAAMATGRFQSPLRNLLRARPGIYCDFLGLSYGSRLPATRRTYGGFRDDLGREIKPQGIVDCCKRMLAIASKPIYITENGVCDNHDTFRARYIAEHLEALCATELPVLRYYYRSFLDGFEWMDGTPARFGLVQTDPAGHRTIKPSGAFYAELIRSGGVTSDMHANLIAGQEYHR